MTKEPFKIGLTGSIGMGKTTTAGFFQEAGVPVWDADAAVARLYQSGARGALEIGNLVPTASEEDASVNREKLRHAIAADPKLLSQIEEVIHPLVQRDRAQFIEESTTDILLFDIPLLFETNSKDQFDLVVVVSAPPEVQKERVLARPGMTEARFEALLSRQMLDSEKKHMADHVIDTGTGLETARKQVHDILEKIRAE